MVATSREYRRQWHAANPERSAGYTLWRRYRITLQDYAEMLERQGGVCAICSKPPAAQRLDVDHDHSCCPSGGSCGQCIRGLLCRSCNTRLYALENPMWRSNAESYLAKRESGVDLRQVAV